MNVKRRPRDSLKGARRVGLTMEGAADDRLLALATHVGVSKSAFNQWLIENVQLDDRGVPVGWPADIPRDGELPIDSA